LHRDVLDYIECNSAPAATTACRSADFGQSPRAPAAAAGALAAGHATPEAAHGLGKPVVLVMNGIHAGEVEGKEAA
jgi:predicted deacylase